MTTQVLDTTIFLSLKERLKTHRSLLIIVGSAVVYYFLNIWLKHVLTPASYGEYSILNSFLTITGTFAVLGGDQLLLREGAFRAGKIEIKKSTLTFNIYLLIAFSFLAPVVFSSWFGLSVFQGSMLAIISALGGISVLVFSILRLSNKLVEAQIQKNIWKALLFAGVLIIWAVSAKLNTTELYLLALLSLPIGIFIHRREINLFQFSFSGTDGEANYSLWLGFAASMLIMTFLTNADRFLIDRYVGRTEMGNYFYLQNFFLFPLTQLQNYSGFKEFSKFKSEFSLAEFHNTISKNVKIAIALSSILLIGVYLADTYFISLRIGLSQNKFLILLLIASGILRIIYAVMSAAMGAVANTKMIRNANLLSSLLFSIPGVAFLSLPISIVSITILFLLFWLIRTLIFYKVIAGHYEI